MQHARLLLSTGCFLLLQGLFAQKPGTPVSNPGGPRPGPSTSLPPSSTQTPTPVPDMGRNSIYLTGKVLMEDGSSPPINTIIEKICNGNPKPLGYTDQKGNFSVSAGVVRHGLGNFRRELRHYRLAQWRDAGHDGAIFRGTCLYIPKPFTRLRNSGYVFGLPLRTDIHRRHAFA